MANSRSSSHEFLGNFHRVVVFVELHRQSLKQLHVSCHQHQWRQPFCILTVDVQLLGGLKMEKSSWETCRQNHKWKVLNYIQWFCFLCLLYLCLSKLTIIPKSWGNNLNRTIKVWHTPIDVWWLWHFTFTPRQPQHFCLILTSSCLYGWHSLDALWLMSDTHQMSDDFDFCHSPDVLWLMSDTHQMSDD